MFDNGENNNGSCPFPHSTKITTDLLFHLNKKHPFNVKPQGSYTSKKLKAIDFTVSSLFICPVIGRNAKDRR